MRRTPFLSVLEPVADMAAVTLQHQSASAIRAGEERLVQPLCALRLALCMDNATRLQLSQFIYNKKQLLGLLRD